MDSNKAEHPEEREILIVVEMLSPPPSYCNISESRREIEVFAGGKKENRRKRG